MPTDSTFDLFVLHPGEIRAGRLAARRSSPDVGFEIERLPGVSKSWPVRTYVLADDEQRIIDEWDRYLQRLDAIKKEAI